MTLTIQATDPDGDEVEITIGAAANGTISGTPPSVTYTPEENYTGNELISVQVSDGEFTTSATITIEVTPVNDAPVAVADSFATSEDTALTVPQAVLLTNDTDVDGDTLTVTEVADAVSGTVALMDDSVVFTPDANFRGDASFSYTVSDGELTAMAQVTVSVDDVNDPPVTMDDTATTDEDVQLDIDVATLLANDSDIEGQTLMVTAVQNPTNGTVTLAGTTITFTPDADYNGAASFEYVVSDGQDSSTAQVAVTVNPVNDAPVAANDTVATDEDTAAAIDASTLLANDSDIEGQTLTVTAVQNPANGTVTLAGTTITFTPDADFSGAASFEYTIGDGQDTGTAQVAVTVNPVNDAPVATNDTVTTDEDTAAAIDASTLLANDSDIEGQTLTVTAVQNPANGTVTMAGTTITFTPGSDYNGAASFEYLVSDGQDTSTAQVAVTVNPVNDAPVAANDTVVTDEDTAAVIGASTLLANDSDVEGQTLTVTAVQNPLNGTVTMAGTTITFTPDADFSGAASFEYTISDGQDTGTAQVTVTVNPVNDAPVAADQSVTTDQDAAVAITLTATDIDSGTLTFSVVTGPANGTLSGTGASLTYTPGAGFSGQDSFTFKANDGSLDSNVAQVSITVNNLNCGNNMLDTGEECDDGNTTDNDGCSSTCMIEGCGDNVVQTGEVCDDGNRTAGDGCRADCLGIEVCGDNIVDSAVGETCDDGNTTPGDGCDGMCLLDPFVNVAAQPISGALSCTSASSNTGRKAGVDQLGRFYVVMICGGNAYVAASTDHGVTWAAPVATGISGVAEVAIEGGAPGIAYVAAVLNTGDLAFTRTTDTGTTWATPTTLATGLSDSEVSIDSFGDAVYIAVNFNGGLRVLRNLAGGQGTFDVTDVVQGNAYHDVFVDKVSGDVWLVSDTPEFHVRQSTDQGASFGAESLPPGQAYYSDWTGSNGFLYVSGTFGDDNIDVIPLSNPSTGSEAHGLPAEGFGSVRTIDADAIGNAYVASQRDSGAVQLDRYLLGSGMVEATDARTIAAAGVSPGVAALPSNNGALVIFTNGTTVYGAVVVY